MSKEQKAVLGYVAVWAVLALGAEVPSTAGLAAGFAILLATSATFVFLPQAINNLGFGGSTNVS